jgi:arylsulfatase A-like enzyme
MGNDVQPQAGFQYWRASPDGGGGSYKDPSFSIDGKRTKLQGYKTALTADFAIQFIEANRARPFFLYIPFHAPHTPFDYQPEADRAHYKDSKFSCFPEGLRHAQRRANFERHFDNRESKTSYSALVTGMDDALGRILRKLDELKLREKTVVVFTADQGWNGGHHGFWGKGNGTIPFNMYEQSTRVPLIWSHPGRIARGALNESLVSSYDFFPTVLDYAGLETPPDKSRPGSSYAAELRGQPGAPREELYFEYCNTRSLRTKNWKYIQRGEGWPHELYDLAADPGEQVNRVGDALVRAQAQQMRERLNTFFEKLGSPPIDNWRSATKQAIPLDSGYYGTWWKR